MSTSNQVETHPRVGDTATLDGAAMEWCPECSERFASVHMRTLTERQEQRRICCVCDARLAVKKRKERKSALKDHWRLSITSMMMLLGLVGYCVCYIWNPGDIWGKITGKKRPVASVSVPAPVPQTLTLSMRSDVLFDFGSGSQKAAGEESMQKMAAVIRQYPMASVVVRGYTDSVGSEQSNLALSTRRAESIRDWLINHGGIPAAQLTVEGMGSKDPVAPNTTPNGSDNPAGREKNRRVTLTLTGIQVVAPASPALQSGI